MSCKHESHKHPCDCAPCLRARVAELETALTSERERRRRLGAVVRGEYVVLQRGDTADD